MDERKLLEEGARIEYEEYLNNAIKEAKKNFKELRSQAASVVDCKIQVFVYAKRPKGYSKVLPDIVKIMVSPEGVHKTQQELIDEVAPRHPEQKISRSLWNKVLQPFEKKAIKKILDNEGLPEWPMKGCKKLSEIKKKLKTHYNNLEHKPRKFKANIEYTKTMAKIGKKSYTVEFRGSKGKTCPSIRVNYGGKRQWLRLDVLGKALLDGEKG